MSFKITGCMEFNEGKYRPLWPNPCTGLDEFGCMRFVNDVWIPEQIEGFGVCSGIQGCFEIIGGIYTPVLIWEEYDNVTEFREDCCGICTDEECTNCYQDLCTPKYLEVTFSGWSWCPDSPVSGGCPGSINSTPYIVEWDLDEQAHMEFESPGLNICVWTYRVGNFFIQVSLTDGKAVGIAVGCSDFVFTHPGHPEWDHPRLEVFLAIWGADVNPIECDDDSVVYPNFNEEDPHCSETVHDRGYGGTATITWGVDAE